MPEKIGSAVSALKNIYYCLSCKSLVSVFVTQIHYVKDPSIKALVKLIR